MLLSNGLNEACNKIVSVYIKVGNESMSSIYFRTQ